MINEKITVNKAIYYIKPDRIDGYYYLGCAPIVYVVKNGEMLTKGSFSSEEIERVCVFVKEDENGKKNYMLLLNKGEYTTEMKKYLLGMLLITNEKEINGGMIWEN